MPDLQPSLQIVPNLKVVPALPLELTDMILDYLHYDEKTLQQCTLVCTSWTAPARSHLFSSITIIERRGDEEYAYNASHFYETLLNNPSIGSYIKDLLIIGHDPSGAMWRHSEVSGPCVARILARLVNVRRLTMKRLEIGASYQETPDFFAGVASLPKLEVIWFYEISFNRNNMPSTQPGPPTPPGSVTQLKALYLEQNIERLHFLEFLKDALSGRRERLEHFFVTLDLKFQFPLYSNIIESAGASLTYLDIDLRLWFDDTLESTYIPEDDSHEYYRESFKNLSFEGCTCLQQLDIWIMRAEHAFPWIAASAILDRMPRSVPLRQVTIAIDFNETSGYDSDRELPEWDDADGIATLDQAVANLPQIQRLAMTNIHKLGYDGSWAYHLSTYARAMTAASARGILHVQPDEHVDRYFEYDPHRFPYVRVDNDSSVRIFDHSRLPFTSTHNSGPSM